MNTLAHARTARNATSVGGFSSLHRRIHGSSQCILSCGSIVEVVERLLRDEWPPKSQARQTSGAPKEARRVVYVTGGDRRDGGGQHYAGGPLDLS